MLIFIDFDDVLFNTKRFREDLRALFARHGVPAEVFDQKYWETQPPENAGSMTYYVYEIERHIDRMEQSVPLDRVRITKAVDELMEKLDSYVFSDAVPFLEKCRHDRLCLVSFGNTPFQQKKVNNSGVTKYFSDVIIEQESKSFVVNHVLKSCSPKDKARTAFIDDRVGYIADVKKNCPGVVTIFVDRPEGRYHDERTGDCDYAVHNLLEADKIIESIKSDG